MGEILPDGTIQGYSCARCGAPCNIQGWHSGPCDLPSPPINYGGPDASVECAWPPCSNRLRRSDAGGPQWCSKRHRLLTNRPTPPAEPVRASDDIGPVS